MKPDWRGIAAALTACLLLVSLPGCGTMRHAHETAPVVYTVEPAGKHAETGRIQRHAGGDDEVMWFLIGFYVFYYIIYGIVLACTEIARVCFEDDDDCVYIAP